MTSTKVCIEYDQYKELQSYKKKYEQCRNNTLRDLGYTFLVINYLGIVILVAIAKGIL